MAIPTRDAIADTGERSRGSKTPGLAKGMLTILSEDEEHLKDFEESMP